MRSQLSFEPHPFIRPPSRSRVYLCPFRGPTGCIKGTSYDQSLYEIHIVSHMWPFSSNLYNLTLKGQIKIIEFLAGSFSSMKHSMTKVD